MKATLQSTDDPLPSVLHKSCVRCNAQEQKGGLGSPAVVRVDSLVRHRLPYPTKSPFCCNCSSFVMGFVGTATSSGSMLTKQKKLERQNNPPPISTLLKLTTLRKTKYHKHTWYLPFSYREKDACNQIYYPPHPPLPGTRSLKRKIRKKREKKDQKMRHSANPPYFGTLRRACSSHDCVKRYEKRKGNKKFRGNMHAIFIP